jgi:hypothetical protein
MKTHPNHPALVGALAYAGTELQNVLKVTHVCIPFIPHPTVTNSSTTGRTSLKIKLPGPTSSFRLRVLPPISM